MKPGTGFRSTDDGMLAPGQLGLGTGRRCSTASNACSWVARLATSEQEHQRIKKTIALAVFSSDAISSTAYATQEILLVVAVGGSSLTLGLSKLVPISIVVAVLLAIVVTSYRQTIFAYPSGGGSYVVSRENLGANAAMVAGASLLVDYILTVAVSICAGVRAITSIPALHVADERTRAARSRGDRVDHASRTCAASRSRAASSRCPRTSTSSCSRAWSAGASRTSSACSACTRSTRSRSPTSRRISRPRRSRSTKDELRIGAETVGTLGLFRLFRGFSSGAVALTGVEAISNGVPAFERNESRNAAITLVWMGVILGSLFLGVSVLAHHLHPIPLETGESVFSQMGRTVFGQGVLYYVLQGATAAILTLAANTAYADFPRLSSIIARDGYLPAPAREPRRPAGVQQRRARARGRGGVLVVIFGGNESKLIPLYAVGVFTSFTLSQTGMVRHHQKEHEPGWRRNIVINAIGAIATLIVTLIIAIVEVHRGRVGVDRRRAARHRVVPRDPLALRDGRRGPEGRRRLQAPPHEPHGRGARRHACTAVCSKRSRTRSSLHPTRLLAVTVVSDEEEQERIEQQWTDRKIDVPLEIVHSPYRELSRPILRFIDELDARYENDIITVVLPEFVVGSWWGQLLHNQSALLLKGRLLFRKGTVVTSVPYHLERPEVAAGSRG